MNWFRLNGFLHTVAYYVIATIKTWPTRALVAARSESAEVSIRAIIGGVIILAAYLAAPQVFYNFFHYLINMVFDALHSSFGTTKDAGDPGTTKNGAGHVTPGGKPVIPTTEKPPSP